MPLHLLFPLASSIVFVFGIMFAKRAISGGASPWTNTFLANAWLAGFWALTAVVQGQYLPVALWWQAALAGLAFVVGQLLTYLAFQYGDVSVATPVFGVKVVMVALLLSLIADEPVGIRVWLGAVLATVGVALVQAGARAPHTGHVTPRQAAQTILLALLAAMALSLFDVVLQFWSRPPGAAKFLPAVFVFTGLFSCGFLPWSDAPPRLAQLKVIKPLLWGSLLMAVQAVSMSYALGQFGDAARINIVYALRGLWAVGLAWALARAFGGAEARHSRSVMLLRLAGAVLLTLSVFVALSQPTARPPEHAAALDGRRSGPETGRQDGHWESNGGDMSDEQIRGIDEQLHAFEWTYNPQSERFEARDSAAGVEWEDILTAVPDLSLNDLMAYEERKQRQWRQAERQAAAA